MNTSPNLTFNILTFKHPEEEYTFYFTKEESENTQRVFHTLVPDEVKKKFGEQEHYYTSFINQLDSFLPVTKKSKPVYRKEANEEAEEVYVREDGSAFCISILKRYYNSLIHAYFKDGFPFPIKLSITCTDPELTEDTKIVRELIDQVYQFSRMYWKSVRQQNLPVTIKYPEIVAEIFPYFVGNEIPDFGKDNLWFL